ncbi:PREDICTED: PRUPE_6G193600, partial [Prunus dulcis]
FDFSEQWFLFFPNLIKYKEKEIRVVLSVKMVSQHQTKDSGSKKNGDKELGMVAPQDKSSKEMKSSKKMKFASSSAETESQTTISDDSKTGRGMSTMPRVVKRKLQKLRPIVEYNKRGKGIGQAHSEMQSYIGVLARSRVPLVDKKWSQIPKDIKEQIWEAVDMAFVVGQGGKNSVLASAAKKWKDFKSTLTRHYILPYTNDKEKLSQPPETYKFIEKAQWDAFVASRLSKDFESVHSQHAQIREKLEYNHRLSRKGYAGLEDQLEETMPGVEIDRSTLWKRARQDKHGNIPDPKVAEKAKLIDELQKQVSEGKVSVYGSNDVLTMALGPEHPGRLRGVGAGISPRQYFNLPKPQRVSFDDRLKESLRVLLQEETKKMEAKAKEEALRMEARTKQLVEAEREHFLSQLSQLIPNFDPTMLKTRISQSPKNPMSDKASCSGGDVRSLHVEDDTAKMGKHREDEEKEEEKRDEEKEEEKEKEDEEKHDDKDKILQFTIDKEVFGGERDTILLPEDITQFAGMEEIGATVLAVYMRYLHDVLKQANMCSMVGFIGPATVSANSGTIADRSRLVAARLQKTDGEQIFMMPYIPGRHWVLLIVRAKRETVYFLDPLPGHRVVDEEAKNIVNSAIKIYNSHIGRAGRKAVIWKTLSGTPKQPSNVECGYYVMRFMRDIINDPSFGFENK